MHVGHAASHAQIVKMRPIVTDVPCTVCKSAGAVLKRINRSRCCLESVLRRGSRNHVLGEGSDPSPEEGAVLGDISRPIVKGIPKEYPASAKVIR